MNLQDILSWCWRDDVWLVLDRFGIFIGDLFYVGAFAGALAGLLQRERIKAWLRRNSFPRVADGEEFATGEVEGIVFLVSRADLPGRVMRDLRPKRVGFVYSERSEEAARQLRGMAERLGIDCVGAERVEDPDNPAQTREATAKLLTRLLESGPRERCAVDVTGGKVPMSLGAFMAAEEAGTPSIYVTAEYDARLQRPRAETARVVRLSTPY